jgi:3-methylcrotonyl-CoA carboxylase alpha subunit
MITGPTWWMAAARGRGRAAAAQEQLAIHGHAIEARIYAENPEKASCPPSARSPACAAPLRWNSRWPHGATQPAAVRIDPACARAMPSRPSTTR